jgi:hypothetical protein
MSKRLFKCSVCGEEMCSSVKARFRIGGTGGTWKLIFGEWAELGEKMIPFYIYVCPNCGKIELFVDEKTKNKLLRSKGQKQNEKKM